MSEKLPTDERIRAIEKRMSRRQFARFAALGGIAAMISTKAYSHIPLTTLTNPATDEYVGDGCAFILGRLDPNITVEEVVYAPIQPLVEKFRDSFDSISHPDEYKLLDGLVTALENTKGIAGTLVTYADLCVYSEGKEPPGVSSGAWKALYAACNGGSSVGRVSDYISMPFLHLGNHAEREKLVKPLLTQKGTGSKSIFQEKVGGYKFLELFNTSYVELFSRSGRFDGDGYNLVRLAFIRGVFKIDKKDGAEQGPIHAILPNKKCYSSLDGCRPGRPKDYCALDNGVPTSSTDFCL